MFLAGRARFQPAFVPRRLTTSRACLSAPSIRRMTTGLVATLEAIRSDVTGPGARRSATCRNDRTWIAMVRRLFALMYFSVTYQVTSTTSRSMDKPTPALALLALLLSACTAISPPATSTDAAIPAPPASACNAAPDAASNQFIVGYGSLMEDE